MNNSLIISGRNSGLTPFNSIADQLEVRELKRGGREIATQAVLANLKEDARMNLTQTALTNVGMLTAMETNLQKSLPFGFERMDRFKMIVDTYTLAAAKHIAQF